jgi:type 1 fimbriae regulatory protein FimB/type 1 fimbriae regulatory protein FimE
LKASATKKTAPAKAANRRQVPPSKPRNKDVREREFLTPAEVKKLIEAARSTGRHGERDALLILMSYRHALRVGEIIDLEWDQVKLESKKIHVERMKNGDDSIHYLESDELMGLRRLRRDHPQSNHVFCSEREGPLSSRTVHWIVARAGENANMKFPVHPHMLRHSKGFQLAGKGVDTRAIQAYFGHKNIQHTANYTKLDKPQFKDFGKDL